MLSEISELSAGGSAADAAVAVAKRTDALRVEQSQAAEVFRKRCAVRASAYRKPVAVAVLDPHTPPDKVRSARSALAQATAQPEFSPPPRPAVQRAGGRPGWCPDLPARKTAVDAILKANAPRRSASSGSPTKPPKAADAQPVTAHGTDRLWEACSTGASIASVYRPPAKGPSPSKSPSPQRGAAPGEGKENAGAGNREPRRRGMPPTLDGAARPPRETVPRRARSSSLTALSSRSPKKALASVPELSQVLDLTPPPLRGSNGSGTWSTTASRTSSRTSPTPSPRSPDEDSFSSRHSVSSEKSSARALATSFCESEDSRDRISAALLEKLLRKLGKKGLRVPPLCGCAVPPADPAGRARYVRRMACSTAHARNCEFFGDPRKLQRALYDLLSSLLESQSSHDWLS